jgi:hypothetical protein
MHCKRLPYGTTSARLQAGAVHLIESTLMALDHAIGQLPRHMTSIQILGLMNSEAVVTTRSLLTAFVKSTGRACACTTYGTSAHTNPPPHRALTQQNSLTTLHTIWLNSWQETRCAPNVLDTCSRATKMRSLRHCGFQYACTVTHIPRGLAHQTLEVDVLRPVSVPVQLALLR